MSWRSRALPRDLAQRLLDHDRDAVPEALNLADDRRADRREEALELLDTLERESPFPGATRIGLTGAPGAGKSTLLDALVRELRPKGETVAIVAIDPSSRTTGGALLGDRIRVRSGASDPGVFIRSMAARDQLGGLAESAWSAVIILAAAFDRVFVETVGVGQSESDVAALVDTLIYIATPGAGDTLQFMKAGVLEYPDVFVVNKADLGPAATRTASELSGSVSLGDRGASHAKAAVILTSARDGEGIGELVAAIDAHRERLIDADALRERRLHGREIQLLGALERRYGAFGIEQFGGRRALREHVCQDDSVSAFALLARLSLEIEEALRKSH
jgi:LAO/AO transport system kinase